MSDKPVEFLVVQAPEGMSAMAFRTLLVAGAWDYEKSMTKGSIGWQEAHAAWMEVNKLQPRSSKEWREVIAQAIFKEDARISFRRSQEGQMAWELDVAKYAEAVLAALKERLVG